MSKNELQTLLDNTPAKSYKDKVARVEEYLTSIADGENIVIGNGNEVISPVEEFVAPCYVISPQGAKRIVYAIEDCVIATVHANPTNTEDLDELARINVAFNWEQYEEYLKENKL